MKKPKKTKLEKLPNVLISAKDVKSYRKLLLVKQGYIDPILGCPLLEKDAVLDHDHQSQHARAALSRQINAFEGKVANAYIRMLRWNTNKSLPDILRSLADYLERDYTNNAFHPKFIDKAITEFTKLPAAAKDSVLGVLGLVACGKNDKARRQSMLQYMKSGQIDFNHAMNLISSASLGSVVADNLTGQMPQNINELPSVLQPADRTSSVH